VSTNKGKERVPQEMNSDKVGEKERKREREGKHKGMSHCRVMSWIGNNPLEHHGSSLIYWMGKSF